MDIHLSDEASKKLFKDIRLLVDETKSSVATFVNSALVVLYWHIGKKISKDIVVKEERADYGKRIINNLAIQLTQECGRGFTRDNLFRMLQFYKAFPNFEIVGTLSRQLSWSHFVEILVLKDDLKIQFYCEMCRLERWSVRTLHSKIQGMLYERTAISKNTESFIKKELTNLGNESKITPMLVFKDPYLLDFLDLPKDFSESSLENAILAELSAFIRELGNDFCFLERQKRITIGGDDFYVDLLFFHRGLKRLIVCELKLGKFSAAYKGQMELYLRYLDKYERKEGEDSPLGIILCAEKNQEQVELMEMSQSGIHVAEYLTQLPSKEILQKKLHLAINIAREKLIHKKVSLILEDGDTKKDNKK